MDAEAFRWRVAETIAWCAPRASLADPEGSLRSPELRSPAFDYESRNEYAKPEQRVAEVERIAATRARLLRESGHYPAQPARDLAGGKLLVVLPDESLAEGACGMQSRWFFSRSDVPAWDTWLWFEPQLRRYTDRAGVEREVCGDFLACWIPPAFVPFGGKAIEVSSTACVEWASIEHDPFAWRPYPAPAEWRWPAPQSRFVILLRETGLLRA